MCVFSNPDKFQILLEMPDPFDFGEYLARCRSKSLSCQGSVMEYAQKVGLIQMARKRYPERSPFEAYMLLVGDPGIYARVAFDAAGNPVADTNCPGCGGGTVK